MAGDKLQVEVEQVVDGGNYFELCILNFPVQLPTTDDLKLLIKVTEIDPTTSGPNLDTCTELALPYGSLEGITSSKLCYSLAEEDIRHRIESQNVKIQVALRHNGERSPYMPTLSQATTLGKPTLQR